MQPHPTWLVALLVTLTVLPLSVAATAQTKPALKESSGSGFLVSPEGHIITNAHVVSDCTSVNVKLSDGRSFPAKILFKSTRDDLAILATDIKSDMFASFRVSPLLQLGENIFVYGFPLVGDLSTSGNFTAGTITALAGIDDDTRYVQISAPVQPGNSGGPLLDSGGRVIGVVTSKLNTIRYAVLTHDIAQNINFAIRGSNVTDFLSGHSIKIAVNNDNTKLSGVDIANFAKKFTYCVECLKTWPQVVNTAQQRGPNSPTSQPNDSYRQSIQSLIQQVVLTTQVDKLDAIKPFFADTVYFYGKTSSRDDIFSQKIQYFQRWEILHYDILDLDITPLPGTNEYRVKSKIRFYGKRPNKEVRGITETTWGVKIIDGKPQIIYEASKLLERF